MPHDDPGELPQLIRRTAYDRRYVPLADGSFYWHLYFRGERVNGGLSKTRDDAMIACARAVTAHLHGYG